jgi:hypothetical protein
MASESAAGMGLSIILWTAFEAKWGVRAYNNVYGAILVLSWGEQLYANVILGTSRSQDAAD